MVKISDILKGVKEKDEKKPLSVPALLEGTPQPPEDARVEKEEPKLSELRISSVVKERGRVLNNEESKELYEEAISLAREIQGKALTNGVLEWKSIAAIVERLVEQLILNNGSLLELTTELTQSYLYSHAVNVCIFSIKIGIGLGYDRAELIQLGLPAFLHDIGMVKCIDLANQPRKLDTEEYNKIKNHPIIGSEILKKTKELSKRVICVVLQQHERIDGSGYPHGLKGKSIDTHAKIVGLADAYEAMMHARAHRDKYMPKEVIQELLKTRHGFEGKLIKTLIEEVGIFPVGCFVRLNTKEIGMVIKINRECLTRPVIEIIIDSYGERLKQPRQVDLADNPNLHIKDCLKEKELLCELE